MTQAILALADAFQLQPIVEGIETRAQLQVATELGAPLIQGYYFSKPMPADEVINYLNSMRKAPDE